MKRITYTKKDFAWTGWGATEIKKAADEVVAHKKKKYAEIKKIPACERTFENTIYAIEAADYDVIDNLYFIDLLVNASPKESVRKAAKKAINMLESKLVDIEFDEGLYRAVKEYSKKNEKLKGEDKKLFEDMLLSYKRMGFELSAKKQKELKKNIKKLNKLSTDFSNNINEYKDSVAITKDELAGLPENYIKGLSKDKKGRYIVTLDYPDFFPFMKNAESAPRRKELMDKSLQKGGEKNMKLLSEILELRRQNAKLLGYDTHADFKTEVKTAKTAKKALSFVHGLMGKIRKGTVSDMSQMTELKKRFLGIPNVKLEYYDILYYINQLQKEKFNVDSEKVREYFPLETVKKGTFEIYSKLLSVQFQKLKGYPLWHKDVELYAVKDSSGQIISYFLLDMHPRENKYGHACVSPLVYGKKKQFKDEYTAPMACMLANFPKPSKTHPSLLSHGEVETFFHEFGHIMHDVLTTAKYASQAGYSVAWDFVEAPSQMLENWVWDKKMLNILSKHYKTKKNLPKGMLDNMLKAKDHMVYYFTMRQLVLAMFDLTLHTKNIKNPSNLYNDLVKEYVGVTFPKENIWPAGFGHLMGYDAGYYGYMWSKVFASDMFTKFQKNGLLDKKIGDRYKKWILEKGSSMDEMELLKKFLGRKPSNKAFLKEIGL
ncbi:Thimet oligopeptidase [hydrothermal vent metagenome]|uniref:Thimet oligopeptidase n=1 Tax=hydrothermal vent metagenome TaxID=652676 RepID=A0A3B0TTN1_9ZZZZ